jgi:flavin reductase (DIM6/NTAB) family NADH-FMN oxidoreductase RutF
MLSANVHRLELREPPRTGLTDSTGTSFREAMREIACGVSIITLGAGEDRAGLTATSVSRLSAHPPALLVCVDRGSSSTPALARLGAFEVNVLAADQREVAELFAGGSALSGPERFKAGSWLTLPGGVSGLAGSVAVNAKLTSSLSEASMRSSSAACGECSQAAARELSSPGAVRMTRSAGAATRLPARSGSPRARPPAGRPPPSRARITSGPIPTIQPSDWSKWREARQEGRDRQCPTAHHDAPGNACSMPNETPKPKILPGDAPRERQAGENNDSAKTHSAHPGSE